jgi:hypothetical protein
MPKGFQAELATLESSVLPEEILNRLRAIK